MRLTDLLTSLNEAPIVDYAHLGDWQSGRRSGFSDKDQKLLKNPKVEVKARQKFGQTEVNLNFYFVNLPQANKSEFRERGMVSPDFLSDNIPKLWNMLDDRHRAGIVDPTNGVNVLFIGNYGFNKVPMTPWIMAHRLGHAIQSSALGRFGGHNRGGEFYHWVEAENEIERVTKEIFKEVYNFDYSRHSGTRGYFWSDPFVARFFENIGTMRSARQNNLGGRPYEFLYELFAQYTTTGTIVFRELPKFMTYKGRASLHMQNPEEDIEYGNMMLNRGLDMMLGDYFDSCLHDAVGKYLLM